jgi:hypothetical protein
MNLHSMMNVVGLGPSSEPFGARLQGDQLFAEHDSVARSEKEALDHPAEWKINSRANASDQARSFIGLAQDVSQNEPNSS